MAGTHIDWHEMHCHGAQLVYVRAVHRDEAYWAVVETAHLPQWQDQEDTPINRVLGSRDEVQAAIHRAAESGKRGRPYEWQRDMRETIPVSDEDFLQ